MSSERQRERRRMRDRKKGRRQAAAHKAMRCGGVIGPDVTRDELIARGFTPEDADEVLAFVRRLIERGRSTQATKERDPC